MIIDKQYILRQIAGDYVIIPTGKTTLEFNGMITVNEQGAFLWKKLGTEITEEDGKLTLTLDSEDGYLGSLSSVLPKNV